MAQFELLLDDWLTDNTSRITLQEYTEVNFANGTLIPTTVDLATYTKKINEYTAEVMGETDYDDELSDDIPESSIKIGMDEYRTWHMRQSFSYTYEQMKAYEQASAMSKTPMASSFLDMPARAAVGQLIQRANPLAAYGRGSSTGLLNDSNLPTLNRTVSLNGLTPQELLFFMMEQMKFIIESNSLESNYRVLPDTVLASYNLMLPMVTPTISASGTSESVETVFRRAFPFITKIHYTSFCGTGLLEKYNVQTPGTNRDRMLFYQRSNPDILRRKMSVVENYPTSYTKGAYWAGYIQTFGQTIWTNPMYSRLITYPTT
jgi:hypothetical protein